MIGTLALLAASAAAGFLLGAVAESTSNRQAIAVLSLAVTASIMITRTGG